MKRKSRLPPYQEAEILSSSPEQLVVIMYRELSRSLAQAADHIDSGNIVQKGECLARASGIVLELLACLDYDAGGEFAARLGSLYGFFLSEIEHVSKALDADRLRTMMKMVHRLEEAWEQAATRTIGVEPAQTTAAVR